ncbi:MAG: hypothetical protein R3214_13815 [Christiangramia sp.]|nr:hypothetical protein [Christiangramia sp.]
MNITHILKLAGKFVVRGFIFKAGKKLALKGGRAGIGAGALIAGGYLAYQLLEEREKQQKKERKNRIRKKKQNKKIVV